MMRARVIIFVTAIVMLCMSHGTAQLVRYSPYFRGFSVPFFQVAGQAGEYYWVEKEKPFSSRKSEARPSGFQQLFEVFDQKMNVVQKIATPPLPDETIKEFLVAGATSFDRLLLTQYGKKTSLLLKRFSPDGTTALPEKIICTLPLSENGKSFLLLRSPNKTRLALLAFESRTESTPLLHVTLFDAGWNILVQHVIDSKVISQPCIQDDFVSFPIEEFDNLPIKLTDSGEWMMAAPSRTANAFLFLHGCDDGTVSSREIRLANNFSIEDIAVSIDQNKTGASAGILSSYQNSSLRKLHVVHYSMSEGRFDFDSAYLFNTFVGDVNYKTTVRETISGLDNGGYIFCKQYSAGDLSVFYFPTNREDSTWATTLKEEQKPEMNWPSLSYLVLPSEEKLLFMYNTFTGYSGHPISSAMDRKGNAGDEPLAFWKFNRALNFQHGRRISNEEVAVPYRDAPGFAIIRL